MLRIITLAAAAMAFVAAPAGAQSAPSAATLQQTAAGLPVWAWIAIAVVVLAVLVVLAASRRKRRQAVIKTRIG